MTLRPRPRVLGSLVRLAGWGVAGAVLLAGYVAIRISTQGDRDEQKAMIQEMAGLAVCYLGGGRLFDDTAAVSNPWLDGPQGRGGQDRPALATRSAARSAGGSAAPA